MSELLEVNKNTAWVLLFVFVFACFITAKAQDPQRFSNSIRLHYGLLHYNSLQHDFIDQGNNLFLSTGLTYKRQISKISSLNFTARFHTWTLENSYDLETMALQGMWMIQPRKISKTWRINRLTPYAGAGIGVQRHTLTINNSESEFDALYIPVEAGLNFNISSRWAIGLYADYKFSFDHEAHKKSGISKKNPDIINSAGITLAYHFGKNKNELDFPIVRTKPHAIEVPLKAQTPEKSPQISIRVMDATEKPLPGIQVTLDEKPGITDDSGQYSFEYITPGAYSYTVSSAVYNPEVGVVELSGQNESLIVRLSARVIPEKGISSEPIAEKPAEATVTKVLSDESKIKSETDSLLLITSQLQTRPDSIQPVSDQLKDDALVQPAHSTPAKSATSINEQLPMQQSAELQQLITQTQANQAELILLRQHIESLSTYILQLTTYEHQSLKDAEESTRQAQQPQGLKPVSPQIATVPIPVEPLTTKEQKPSGTEVSSETIAVREFRVSAENEEARVNRVDNEAVSILKKELDSLATGQNRLMEQLTLIHQQYQQLSSEIGKKPPQPEAPAKPVISKLPEYSINFATNSSAVIQAHLPKLVEFAYLLNNDLEKTVQLSGFADATGDPTYNMHLSQRRVQTVKSELTKLGVNAKQIVEQYFGSEKASGKENPDERRVDLKIY